VIVFWSKQALKDFDELATFISEQSEKSAALVEARIHREAQLLSSFPLSGRAGQTPGTRERAVGRTPFLLVYRVDADQIQILRVLRGARNRSGQIS
jgi:addiction module RelE/StbE family toxin